MMGEESNPKNVRPESVAKTIEMIDYYIVENEKTARRFIKKIYPEKKQPELKISLLNKHTDISEYAEMLQPCLNGINVGLMSEAGCPGIADPAAVIAKIAHEKGIQVVPLVGPSSIRSEEHTSELQSRENLVCRLLLEKKRTDKET